MQDTLRAMQAKRAEGDRGFTLIELLVVVVIIGVLVAIAIPVYLNYREGAANKSAQSDVRGAITAVEQYYTQHNAYPAANNGANGADFDLGPATPGVRVTLSDRTNLKYLTDGTDYAICARNDGGNATYRYGSSTGGSVAATGGSYANCAL